MAGKRVSDEARGVDERVYAARVDGLAMARATAADVEATLALYETAYAWMRLRGIHPGEPPIPQRDIVTGRIGRGLIWLARAGAGGDGVAPLGAIVPKWEDDGTWRDVPEVREGDALYVHGLVSSREPEGRGVGLRMLRWAEQVTANAGRPYLRLDCMARNPMLRGYYERAGFAYRGDFARSDITLSRYEKRIGEGE
jgi:protein-tyrosine phosphatase